MAGRGATCQSAPTTVRDTGECHGSSCIEEAGTSCDFHGDAIGRISTQVVFVVYEKDGRPVLHRDGPLVRVLLWRVRCSIEGSDR